MSSLESTAQHVARRLDLLTNWLALVALLGIGIVWGPSPHDGTATPDSTGAALHARAEAPGASRSLSDRSHEAQSPPARTPRRG